MPKLQLIAAAVLFFAGPAGAQAAGSTMYGWDHLLHQMDRDNNGVISKDEFLQFVDKMFKRLDINHNGKLEGNELRSLVPRKSDRVQARQYHSLADFLPRALDRLEVVIRRFGRRTIPIQQNSPNHEPSRQAWCSLHSHRRIESE